jgi:hypothetical protein
VFAKPPSSEDICYGPTKCSTLSSTKNLGIEGFAAKYTTDSGAMENEANQKGDQAVDNTNEMIRLNGNNEKMSR